MGPSPAQGRTSKMIYAMQIKATDIVSWGTDLQESDIIINFVTMNYGTKNLSLLFTT